MGKEIAWGILGNSTIGRKCVVPALKKATNGRTWALATRRPGEAREVLEDNGIERLYDDYDQLIDDPVIDAVYIPLPNHLHRPWVLKALRAGKHVLCEKPLACNAQEAQEMASAAHHCDRLLMEAMMYRFHPRTMRVKHLVAAGAVGKPRLIRAAFCFAMEPELLENGDNFRLRSHRGGGSLLDVGCYGVSIARWLLEAEPDSVLAEALYLNGGSVDIQTIGMLRFGNEAQATVEASFCAGLQQTYTIVGSEGAIELPHDAFIPWENEAVFERRGKDQETGAVIALAAVDEYQVMVEAFAGAILSGDPTPVPIDDTIANMTVLDALAESAQTGKRVSLGSKRDISHL